MSDKVANPEVKYVIMGGCAPDIFKYYLNIDIHGRFLSIIEASDTRGTCERIFESRKHLKSFEEIELNTGLNHGFIYKPFAAWVDAVLQWFQKYTPQYQRRKAISISGY